MVRGSDRSRLPSIYRSYTAQGTRGAVVTPWIVDGGEVTEYGRFGKGIDDMRGRSTIRMRAVPILSRAVARIG